MTRASSTPWPGELPSHGDVHYVVVVGDQLTDDGTVIGTHGFYVDVTPTLSQEKQELSWVWCQ